MRIFRRIADGLRLQARCLWAVLLGRRLDLYANILAGNPTGYRLYIEGSVAATDRALLDSCLINCRDAKAGIYMGMRSSASCCVVNGIDGAGFQLGRL